jgi:zinc D-Ala-D-Ala dipeptidase
MPSDFDDFSLHAHRKNHNMTAEAKKNMALLTKVMNKHGFTGKA